MKKPHLLIISDTPMWHHEAKVHVFEATLREVEMLTNEFENITWLGASNPGKPNANARPESTGNITCITLPLLGGGGIWNKLKQVLCLPWFFVRVLLLILKYKYVHTRAPSVPAGMAILISKYDKRRHYWHKFAGNWVQKHPPKSYLLQKKLMIAAKNTKIAINGYWPNSPPHVLSFENPCFSEDELAIALQVAEMKKYNSQLELLFVGRMEWPKGPGRIIDAINLLPETVKQKINVLRLVGKGMDDQAIREKAKSLTIPFEITGPLGRKGLNQLYSSSHIFLLPSSASEGFPKVVAEAAAYGCIPVTSDVSAIGQYVKDGENGILLQSLEPKTIAKRLGELILDTKELPVIAKKATEIAKLYTYERYNERIATEVFQLR
ncbi:MAG: glycosyltransferase [Flavobacteriaceae bacterium]|nr:glycosyltransferase [Flavobacteriaceae bacterium]